jgi:hypothetical protein
MSTFVDRGVSRGQRGGSPTVVNLSFVKTEGISDHVWISNKELNLWYNCLFHGLQGTFRFINKDQNPQTG